MDSKVKVSIHDIIPLIKEKLDSSSEVTLTVTGNSMYPFFIDNLTNVTLEKPIKPLKKMDIVLYKTPNNTWALHRIIKVKNDHLVICGDGQKRKEYIKKEEVIGILKKYEFRGKVVLSDDKSFKIKSKIWMTFYPVRRYLIAVLRKFDRRLR